MAVTVDEGGVTAAVNDVRGAIDSDLSAADYLDAVLAEEEISISSTLKDIIVHTQTKEQMIRRFVLEA